MSPLFFFFLFFSPPPLFYYFIYFLFGRRYGQIWDSNRPTLRAALASEGVRGRDGGILPDDRAVLTASIRRAAVGHYHHLGRRLHGDEICFYV
jgi:hypothetical protein